MALTNFQADFGRAYRAALRATVNVVPAHAMGFSGCTVGQEAQAQYSKSQDDDNKRKDGKDPDPDPQCPDDGTESDGGQTDDQRKDGCNIDKDKGGFWNGPDGGGDTGGWQ